MIGEKLPEWIAQEESIKDGRLYLVGYSEMSADKSEHYISKAALMDAEVKLISEAPSEMRVITQNSLTGAGVDSSEYMQIQTKLQEVVGLMGFKSHESTCRKMLRFGESRNSVSRACWHRASVSLTDLRKAYHLTMQKKYGDAKATKFDDLMKKEIDTINNAKRFDSEERQPANLNSVSN
jgi:hypothetical protein